MPVPIPESGKASHELSFYDLEKAKHEEMFSLLLRQVERINALLARIQQLEAKVAEMDEREVSEYEASMIVERANQRHC